MEVDKHLVGVVVVEDMLLVEEDNLVVVEVVEDMILVEVDKNFVEVVEDMILVVVDNLIAVEVVEDMNLVEVDKLLEKIVVDNLIAVVGDMLLGLIGKALNKNIEERLAQKDAEDARNHILRFGDEIKNKVRHSEEYFNQILDDITKYEKYCNEHKDFQNARTVQTTEIIKRVYKKCYEENDFL